MYAASMSPNSPYMSKDWEGSASSDGSQDDDGDDDDGDDDGVDEDD